MLDGFYVFTKGGLLLFTWRGGLAPSDLKGGALDLFARAVLVGDTGTSAGDVRGREAAEVKRWAPGSGQTAAESYAAKYTVDNRNGLVYVAFYQRALVPHYAERLIDAMRSTFVRACEKRQPVSRAEDVDVSVELWSAAYDGEGCAWFQERFEALMKKFEGGESGRSAPVATRRKDNGEVTSDAEGGAENDCADAEATTEDEAGDGDFVASPASLDKLRRRGRDDGGRRKDGGRKAPSESPRRRPKVATKWDRYGGRRDENDIDDGSLDFSEASDATAAGNPYADGPTDLERLGHARMDMDDDDDDDDEANSRDGAGAPSSSKPGWFGSMMINFVGKSELERDDVRDVMEQFRQRLMSKNVAEEIATKLTASVESALLGKKLESFTSVYSLARSAMRGATIIRFHNAGGTSSSPTFELSASTSTGRAGSSPASTRQSALSKPFCAGWPPMSPRSEPRWLASPSRSITCPPRSATMCRSSVLAVPVLPSSRTTR